MRSFNLKTSLTLVGLTVSALAAPFAAAHAAQDHRHDGLMDVSPSTMFQGPRIDSIVNQIKGIQQGIADGRQEKLITPAQANRLDRQSAAIIRSAERTAAADHGQLPSAQYNRLMRRVDYLNEKLLNDTNRQSSMGSGS